MRYKKARRKFIRRGKYIRVKESVKKIKRLKTELLSSFLSKC
jgi:hypothetical protein